MSDNLEVRYKKANDEWHKLIEWSIKEKDKISRRLCREGTPLGLDTNREEYEPVNKEFKRRTLALYDKYDLPNKPKL